SWPRRRAPLAHSRLPWRPCRRQAPRLLSRPVYRCAGSCANLPADLPDLDVIKPSDRLAIEQGGRRAGAKAKAIDRLERHRTVVRRFMEVDAEQLLKLVRHLV